MEITTETCSTVPAAPTETTHAPNTKNTEDEEEMPLLFMDELPPNFRQSAQLAAIATFMADSDDDAAVDCQEDASDTGNDNKQRRQLRHKSARTRRRQQPYAKPPQKDKEPKSNDTKELQLFLSMFHVS
ncbi:hypothetical protein F441_05490 [Phytophthora nicotianae CJ01A1]|uniref:Uncharacterized protein n=5 Tax=Phytophthora nicotianae TaxID=4792 RepID=W2QGJ7_PHYN3|nr:hypothetical protein PPTG_09654 [Phytophthora nicotianae INRA-310]ETK91006.1 hypothetical protein L915_05340 [Phytophthora nicotianae]ETP20848.1 hypothetical protein F441_05490 [Phytophthora nicotianae CJ01A1]ETL44407.1 hypothetical protein L916_05296 [Phytophthora nicotianae]ETL97570.1 hypothetical protein L917_05178 [Phytophthora nicotianae]ETM50745.1 hypothetical protein L914_05294 [Phytophthora nicotianae]